MTDISRSYRSSQLISPFGPGAIVDIGDESLLMIDINQWPKKLEHIKLERLTKAIGIRALKKPPTIKDWHTEKHAENSLMSYRFPRWLFCPRCRHLRRWKSDDKTNDLGAPICKNSSCQGRTMMPMRFVVACESGHLQDVPWDRWAHMNEKSMCEKPESNLYFEAKAESGSGLGSLQIRCKNPNCGASNNLANIMQKGALKVRCSGKQPWEYQANNEFTCDEQELHVLQRGASNLYYPIIRSALDIPATSKQANGSILDIFKGSDDYEDLMNALARGKRPRARLIADEIAEDFGIEGGADAVLEAVEACASKGEKFTIPSDEGLRFAEWQILTSGNLQALLSNTFQARVASTEGADTFNCERLIKRTVLIDKLREVRAFLGFNRVKPNEEKAVIMNDNRTEYSWLPAIEVFGEGIFIEFNQDELESWKLDNQAFVQLRRKNAQTIWESLVNHYLPEPTAKLIVLHTFAHLLIRQLSFESGYSSGALRERIYASEGQAGVLIYTADGDSEGSLGGLIQQGEANRLYPAIIAALEAASWCSNDPVCSESESLGITGLNRAACHSCSLVSETSCEFNNLLLDRKLLIGDHNGAGLFSEVLKKAAEGDD